MSQFKVYQDYSADATMVSNIFIDNYMKDANDAQIKIYLYLLRVLSAHQSCSISDLADKFNYTEKDVQRALRYWERAGLLALDFDDSKNLIGVRLLDVVERQNTTLSLAPVVRLPIKTEAVETEERTLEETPAYVKPDYSLDDIKSFKQNASYSELLFVVEQYLGKPLTPSEIKTVLFFCDVLGFSSELIDYLFDYCIGKGKRDFRYIEKVAIGWKEEGITTPKQAARASKKYDKTVYSIMNALGKNNPPTKKEADFCIKWTNELGFDIDVISQACERTVLATDSHRFEYADKILCAWYSAGVHHKNDIKTLDEAHQASKKVSSSNSNTNNVSTPAYKQFSHREYDYAEIEKKILNS